MEADARSKRGAHLVRLTRAVLAVVVVGSGVLAMSSLPASAAGHCADYATQEDAEAAVSLYPGLDRDHDGVVCESLPHRSGGPAASPPPASAPPLRIAATRACTADPTGSVTRLYLAYFLRAPDAAGLSFWVDRCNRNVSSLVDVSDAFAGSPEFNLRYGALDNPAFVTLVYKNVLGRTPDQGGLQGSVDFLGRGARRGEVMLGFSESPEFIAKSGVA